jgi:hypothetical protein
MSSTANQTAAHTRAIKKPTAILLFSSPVSNFQWWDSSAQYSAMRLCHGPRWPVPIFLLDGHTMRSVSL